MKAITTQVILLFLSAALAAARPAHAGNIQYAVTDLGELRGPISIADAMNNQGQVVGWAEIYTQYAHAFLSPGSGPLLNLGSFGGDYSVSVATGINNSSVVVGYSDTATDTHAFVWTQSGGMQDLGTLGGAFSEATAINNLGQIVGFATTSNGADDGFICSGTGPLVDLGPGYLPMCINDAGIVAANGGSGTKEYTYVSSGGTSAWVNIGSLGGSFTQPRGMNNLGEIVGESALTTSYEYGQAFLYSGGTMTDLGTFGGVASLAYGVNDFGVVVGSADLPGDQSGDGFVYYGSGAIEDLNDLVDPSLGWDIGEATAINDLGQIAAEGYKDGEDHALLLTPSSTPEPSSLCLLCGEIWLLWQFEASRRVGGGIDPTIAFSPRGGFWHPSVSLATFVSKPSESS